jgi:hypothetical protein
MTRYQRAAVHDFGILYREAGPREAPVIVLLQGFPMSSHMFSNLIPLLADRFHGAPVGFRLALAHSERITAIISLNGNAYRASVGLPGVIHLSSIQDCLERTARSGGFWCSTTPS